MQSIKEWTEKWWRKAVISPKEAKELEEELETEIDTRAAASAEERSKKRKAEIPKKCSSKGGSKSYEEIREDGPGPIGAVIGTDGKIKTSPQEIVEEAARSWNKLFNKEKKVSAATFMDKYSHLIKKRTEKYEIPPLHANRFREKFHKMKVKRAVAADGWRIRELRDLPDSLLDIGVRLVSLVEEDGGRWPKVITLGITTCIRKGDPADEEAKADPNEVIAAGGEETRPITNMSP